MQEARGQILTDIPRYRTSKTRRTELALCGQRRRLILSEEEQKSLTFCLFKLLKINNMLKISILFIRKFKTSGCLFLARENCRAKKRLAPSSQLSSV